MLTPFTPVKPFVREPTVSTATTHAPPGSAAMGLRERRRAETLREIKATARRLLVEQGLHEALSLRAIARELGMTAPALYRYYSDRDELLTEMITDAYHDLGAALAPVARVQQPADAQAHLLHVAGAYRSWALADPPRFALIFGPPVPGYEAPEDGPTVEAAQGAMANLAEVVHRAAAQGLLGEPMVNEVAPALLAELLDEKHSGSLANGLAPETHQAMLHAWASLHGFVCLEVYGQLNWFTAEARERLFSAQIELAGRAMGFVHPGG